MLSYDIRTLQQSVPPIIQSGEPTPFVSLLMSSLLIREMNPQQHHVGVVGGYVVAQGHGGSKKAAMEAAAKVGIERVDSVVS